MLHAKVINYFEMSHANADAYRSFENRFLQKPSEFSLL